MAEHVTEAEITRLLEQYRPDASATVEWTADRRSATLVAAFSDAPPVRFVGPAHRRRWPAAAAGIAATAAIALALALVSRAGSSTRAGDGPTGTFSAAPSDTNSTRSTRVDPLEKLANLASTSRILDRPEAGQFWYHRVDVYVPKPDGGTQQSGTDANYVAPNGDDWNVHDEGGTSSCTYYRYLGSPNPNHVDAAYLDTLPTGADALDTYLRAHVTGSGSVDEAVFVAISDILHNAEGLVPPDLRAAFIELLGAMPTVTSRTGVPYDGPDSPTATTFTFAGSGTLWFDEATAQLVDEHGAPEYRIVDTLPADVADRGTCPAGDD